ncbi:MAG: glycosyltransferase family 39 protein [Cytophagales bacterium]|nr:glycosyltransferase family 39 protein [Cytophagales bacterium]
MKIVFNNNQVYASLFLIGFFLLVRLFNEPFQDDEGYIGEHAYFFSQLGYVKCEMFRGLMAQEQHFIPYHKLFVWLAGVFIKIFGMSIYSVRAVTVLSTALLLLALYQHASQWQKDNQLHAAVLPHNFAAFVCLTFLLIPVVIFRTVLFRPEMTTTLLGFVSYAWLYRYQHTGQKRYLIFAGLAAGWAALAHLNGLIFVGAGGLVLLQGWKMQQWKMQLYRAALFGIAAAIAFLPYVVEAGMYWHFFKEQFFQPVFEGKTEFTWKSALLNLLAEQARLFWKPMVIFPSVAFFIASFLLWRTGKFRFLLTYAFWLVVLLGILMNDKGRIDYLTYHAPFFALVVATALYVYVGQGLPAASKWHKYAAMLSLVMLMGNGVVYLITQTPYARPVNLAQMNAQIGRYLPKGAWCVVPMNFVYNQIGKQRLISLAYATYQYTGRIGGSSTLKSLADFCDRQQAFYVVLNKAGVLPEEQIADYNDTTLRNQYFELLANTPDYKVLRRRQPKELP